MKYLSLRVISSCIILLMGFIPYIYAEENLDEMMARKARYASASWGKTYLENPTTYVWQPESINYKDITTGHEVFVLVHGPDQSAFYSKEYNTNAWSYDGSTLGVWISKNDRGTNNPNSPSDNNLSVNYRRWLVKSDGSFLKSAEGYAHNDIPEGGFGWAVTENAYYGFGSGSWEGADTWDLCKMTVDSHNIVKGLNVLDTSNATNGDIAKGVSPIKKGLIKRGISYDDEWISVSARAEQDYGGDISSYGHMRIYLNQGQNPAITNYWGVNRGIYEYADHSQSNEYKNHGGGLWAYGLDQAYVHINYTASEHIFFQLKNSGTSTDGGPKWESWDGDSYGSNEIIPLSSAIYREPNPEGFFHPYWGHPSIDRWEKYILYGDGDPSPGTRITRVIDGVGFDGDEGQIVNDISSRGQYDGRHHAWDGWTDYVIFFPYKVGDDLNGYDIMYGRKINFGSGTLGAPEQIVTTHENYSGNYTGYPRPSQSPDGTKVAMASIFLNNSEDSYPYLQYVVAYYPYPPEITQTGLSTGKVTVRFDWQNSLDDPNPRTYTTRGWPNEKTDDRPIPRETNKFRLWRSPDNATWTPVGTVDAEPFKRFDFVNGGFKTGQNSYWEISDIPGDGTWYYAVTSVENSGLESRSLSNTWMVVVSDGEVISDAQETAYPLNPGADSKFFTSSPPAPDDLTVSKGTASGHYRLTWTEPPKKYSHVRYYNIYYSTTGTPPVEPQYRIASIPAGKGITTWLDWNADPNATPHYRITSVDTQGNEGTNTAPKPPTFP